MSTHWTGRSRCLPCERFVLPYQRGKLFHRKPPSDLVDIRLASGAIIPNHSHFWLAFVVAQAREYGRITHVAVIRVLRRGCFLWWKQWRRRRTHQDGRRRMVFNFLESPSLPRLSDLSITLPRLEYASPLSPHVVTTTVHDTPDL